MCDVGLVITLKYLRHVFCIWNGRYIFFLSKAISSKSQTSEPFTILLRDFLSQSLYCSLIKILSVFSFLANYISLTNYLSTLRETHFVLYFAFLSKVYELCDLSIFPRSKFFVRTSSVSGRYNEEMNF